MPVSVIHLYRATLRSKGNIPVLGLNKTRFKITHENLETGWFHFLASSPFSSSCSMRLDEWQWQICSPLSKQLRRQPVQRGTERRRTVPGSPQFHHYRMSLIAGSHVATSQGSQATLQQRCWRATRQREGRDTNSFELGIASRVEKQIMLAGER